MQRPGTEAIRTQIQPSKPKQEITIITNSQNTKRTYVCFYSGSSVFETSRNFNPHHSGYRDSGRLEAFDLNVSSQIIV